MLPDHKQDLSEESIINGFKTFWAQFEAEHKAEAAQKDFSKASFPLFPDEIANRPHGVISEEKDFAQLRLAAAGGNPRALQILADQYLVGIRLPHNIKLAMQLYDLAAPKTSTVLCLEAFRKTISFPLESLFTAAESMNHEPVRDLIRRLGWKIQADLPEVQKILEKLKKTNPLSKQNQILLAIINIFYFNHRIDIQELEFLSKDNDEIAQIAKCLLGRVMLEADPDVEIALEYFKDIKTTSPWYSYGLQYYHMKVNRTIPTELYQTATLYNKAYICFQNKKYEESFNLVCQMLNEGYRPALSILACHYLHGQGVEQNAFQALRLHYEAAIWGAADSQFFMGLRYYNGDLTSCDFAEAVKYFTLAEAQGHLEARWHLANCYAKGHGVEVNPGKAAE
ncbi:MAG TPA: tetratricopeptide repeat protein, partial [Gammaproteobacteria bacterium]|nr:tetratricopeptide repeat protein [Gammaproteobacteria bacterium]